MPAACSRQGALPGPRSLYRIRWPRASLLPRARALAAQLATRSAVTLRYTRVALNMLLRNAMQDGMSHGLALEGYSVMERAQQES